MPVMHKYVVNKKEYEEKLTPVKAIRKTCIEVCKYGHRKMVDECKNDLCPAYPFRFGKDPGRAKDLTVEQREAIGKKFKERLKGEK